MRKFISLNPYTNKLLKEFEFDTKTQILDKLNQCNQAFLSRFDLKERKTQMELFKKQLIDNNDKLAKLITIETGKPITMSKAEVNKSIQHIDYYMENIEKYLQPKQYKTHFTKSYVTYQPLGTVHIIAPFNFPLWLVLKSAVPQLLVGNSVLIRPSDQTPQLAEFVQQLAIQTFENSFNTVFSQYDHLPIIMSHDTIQGVVFIGSCQAGRIIGKVAAENLKKSVLELGGNDPFVVLQSANIDKAVEVAFLNRISVAGQVCCGAKRFIIHEKVYEEFKNKLVSKVSKVKIGDPLDEKTQLGTIASQRSLQQAINLFEQSKKQGINILCGGSYHKEHCTFDPTIVEVDYDNVLMHHEIFAPVWPLIKFKTTEQAVEIANNSEYGLGGMVFGEENEAEKIALEIRTGMISVNENMTSYSNLPFGGCRISGYGRECGEYGVQEFTNHKLVIAK